MSQHKTPKRQAQIQKLKSESSLPDNPITKQIKATVIGFSRPDCKICFGRGRLGFDSRYKDKIHVVPCRCIEYFDLETVQKSWEEARQQAQKNVDAEVERLKNSQAQAQAQDGAACGTELDGKQSSSSQALEPSKLSSGASAS